MLSSRMAFSAFTGAKLSSSGTRTVFSATTFRPTQSQFPQLRAHASQTRLFSSSPRSRQGWGSYPRYQRFGPVRAGVGSLFRRWSARPTFYYEVAGIAGLAGAVYVYNLEEVPVSGRRRFNIISQSWERALGQEQYRQVIQQFQGQILSDGDPRTRQVKRVLERLIPHSGLPADYEWEVNVIDAKEANAFVIPGGKVFVFTGILPICDGDDALAAVLGHEIGHNVARHIAEQMSRSWIPLIAAIAVESFLPGFGQFSQQLLALGFELPKSRAQETEADYIGLMMMAKSCYNPEGAVHLWERMQIEEKKHAVPPELLSTHPASSHREEQLQQLLPKAREVAADSGCGRMSTYVSDFSRKAKDNFSFYD